MKANTIGLDLAKNVFHMICLDEREKEISKRKLRRHQVLPYFANLAPCWVAMEACAGAHNWARKLIQMGHKVTLIAPQHVKPFLRGNKNDYNDARAIIEAATRPGMPTVEIKTTVAQDLQAIHRLRSQCVKSRTALASSIRGLLCEYGIVIPQRIQNLRKHLPSIIEDDANELSDLFCELLERSYDQLVELDERVLYYTKKLEYLAKEDDACRRLQTVPGFGPIVASAFRVKLGNGHQFTKGRDVSAFLGIVPRQHSTGGKTQLLGITKRGDRYLRSQLIHGARSVVNWAAKKNDPLSRWINGIRLRRGWNKAVVATANKLARIAWAILRYGTTYDPSKACW